MLFDPLIPWFLENKRDLPWRHTKDPYRIWVSEIMLQQTRVDTVMGYYERFLERFPTVEALAEADEEEVLMLWQGLGYYSRARNLQKGARKVVSDFSGKFPDNLKDAKSIPGIGHYTAGAILSIAYGIPTPAVDGNVLRVFSRVFDLSWDIADPKCQKRFEALVKEEIIPSSPSDFTEALMELGALICTPKSPSCLLCPMRERCKSYQNGTVEERPVKSPKTKPVKTDKVYALFETPDGRILLLKNPSEGLLGGLWALPGKETKKLHVLLSDMKLPENLPYKFLGNVTHVFTHLRWEMEVYLVKVPEAFAPDTEHAWVHWEALGDYPLPTVYKKLLKVYKLID